MKSLHLVATLLVLISIANIPCKIQAMDMDSANKRWTISQQFVGTELHKNDYALIKTTTDIENLKRLLMNMVFHNYTQHYTTIIAHAIARIDQLEQEQNTQIHFSKTDYQDNTLSELILNYNYIVDNNGKRTKNLNRDLSQFVSWFIEHGVPVNDHAMEAAIRSNRIDIVIILRRHGINPTDLYEDKKQQITFIEYARRKGMNTIATILEKPDSEHSIAWYTYLSKIDSQTDRPNRGVVGTQKVTTLDNVLDSLSRENDSPFQDAISQFNGAELRAVKTYLKEKKPQGYIQKIWDIDQIAPQAQAPSFSGRLHAMLGLVAAAVTATGLYHWFYRTPASGYSEDVLINNTGKSMFVAATRQGNVWVEIIESKKTYKLPQTGTLSITTDVASNEPDLIIDLAAYAANRSDHYLNIGISKNWLSWLFGPLRYTIHWVDKDITK